MKSFQSHITLKNGRRIGAGEPTYVIAEIGSNHDGSLDKAKRLIEAALKAGADAAKIQSFQVHHLINDRWKPNGHWEDHKAWDILDRLTVPVDWHHELKAFSDDIGIDFLSAPFDYDRLKLLSELGVPALKIASGDLTHHGFLRQVGSLKIPVILSTGLAYLGEVEAALNVLAESGCEQAALLHCVSLYPPQFSDANIRAMVTMQQAFQVPVGYSDHTPGHTVPLGAVALGASIIEKHLTDDKSHPGPDHPYALDIPEFTQMVTEIRHMEAALGDGLKRPSESEIPERVGARRAVYAKAPMTKGTPLDPNLLKVVRHAYQEGIGAEHSDRLHGRVLKQDVEANQLLTWDMV